MIYIKDKKVEDENNELGISESHTKSDQTAWQYKIDAKHRLGKDIAHSAEKIFLKKSAKIYKKTKPFAQNSH